MAFLRRSNAVLLCAALAMGAAVSGCVSPAGPVEAVRFVSPDRAGELGRGAIRVVAGEGMDSNALEYRSYAAAVERELERIGYQVLPPARAMLPISRPRRCGSNARCYPPSAMTAAR